MVDTAHPRLLHVYQFRSSKENGSSLEQLGGDPRAMKGAGRFVRSCGGFPLPSAVPLWVDGYPEVKSA
jgi:hypothetical protein